MGNPIELNIYGIKCDSCDYADMSVKVEEYPEWINKQCPNCGENLLTEEDFNNVQLLLELSKIANSILPPTNKSDPTKIEVKMNGTGNMDFEIKE